MDDFDAAGTLHVPYEDLDATCQQLKAAGRVGLISGQYLAPGQVIELHYFTPPPPVILNRRQKIGKWFASLRYRLLARWRKPEDEDEDD